MQEFSKINTFNWFGFGHNHWVDNITVIYHFILVMVKDLQGRLFKIGTPRAATIKKGMNVEMKAPNKTLQRMAYSHR